LIIAIWAAGPPQARAPNFRKRMKIAASESCSLRSAVVFAGVKRDSLADRATVFLAGFGLGGTSGTGAASLASPGLYALFERDARDRQRRYRVEPPPAKERVARETKEDGSR
jgi:hypothetical protein